MAPSAACGRKMRYRWLLLFVIFFTKKQLPHPHADRNGSQEEKLMWGNLPIAAGKAAFFLMPAPASRRGARSAGDAGLNAEGQGRGAEPGSVFTRWDGLRKAGAGGRRAQGMCCALRPPATPVTDRRRSAGQPVRGNRAGSRDEKRLPGLRAQATRQTPGLRSAAAPGRFCRAQDGRKPPQGRGFPFGRRTAAGYDGCRCVMEQAGGGGIPCFGSILRRPVPS